MKNFYEVDVKGWRVRVRAASFSTAARKGVQSLEEDKRLTSKDNQVTLTVKIIKRDVKQFEDIPKFD